MHSGQADVLVDPPVTSHEVRIKHLVVVRTNRLDAARARDRRIEVGSQPGLRRRVVSNVVQERGAGADHVRRNGYADPRNSFYHPSGGHHLRVPVGSRQELAIGVGREQGDVEHVLVAEGDAEHRARLGLDVGPGGHPAVGAIDQLAGRDRVAGGVVRVAAQEHLVGRVRGVRLALVDEGRGLVRGVLDVVRGPQDGVQAGQVGRPRQHHEVTPAAGDEQRVIRLERYKHRAIAALVRQVQAVVEELPEEGEPGVERCGQTDVRCHVLDEQGARCVGDGACPRRCNGSRVAQGLVDDQVARDARL